jgi:hypothetical protein
VSPVLRGLLQAWDKLDGKMDQLSQAVSLVAALAMSSSLVFIKQDDNPLMTTDTWRHTGISHVRDLVKYCEQRQQIQVQDISMRIHQRLRKALIQSKIRLSDLFSRLNTQDQTNTVQ